MRQKKRDNRGGPADPAPDPGATPARARARRGPILEPAREPAAEWVPRDSLVPWAGNPRVNSHAVAPVAKAIQELGWGSVLLVRSATREVIAGHTRLLAAKQLGIDMVPVRFLDVDERQARLLALADNRLGELATWDDAELLAVLSGYSADDALLAGWDGDALAELVAQTTEDPAHDVDDEAGTELRDDALSKLGEVYELGPHRLTCGDSRDPEVWCRLLEGRSLDMVWTDPPYGVSYVGATADALTIENDDLNEEQLADLLRRSLARALDHSRRGAPWYVAAPGGPLGLVFGAVLRELDVFRQQLVWVKDAFVLGRLDYHYRHEDIFYGWAPGARHRWYGGRDRDTVLEHDRPRRNADHPTMKPPELVQQCILHSSRPGDLVGDPFGGSGTTLLAAASRGRVAALIELDPRYCDVIRRRWTLYARTAGVDPGPGALDA